VTVEQAAADEVAGDAVAGTVVGAAAGAALGAAAGDPASGAAAGAGIGLLGGSAVGSGRAAEVSRTVQHRYDVAYVQCSTPRGIRFRSQAADSLPLLPDTPRRCHR
jgi:hypothetical protein